MSIYANGFFLKTLDVNGTAGKLTKLNYAFENIDPANLTCFAANAPSSSDENSATGNDGASDAWADYQRGFTADESVDGVADSWGDSLKGNFNQLKKLKKLKARYPNLKTLVTIGGWTFSKYFSDVAATDASRKKFVRSCIDMYIRGNLPQIGDDPAGGTGVAAGVFARRGPSRARRDRCARPRSRRRHRPPALRTRRAGPDRPGRRRASAR